MKNFKTKTIIFSLACMGILFTSDLFAQKTLGDIPTLDSLEIAKAVTYFEINDDALEGRGAEILKQHIASSKFFVLGENHRSTQISILTRSLAPLLDASGYKVAAFEVGPYSAGKLKELSEVPDATRASLKDFNNSYFVPAMEMSAIPMFNSVPDAEFLTEFSRTGMEFWGLDQEFVFAVLFLGDDLVASKSNEPNYEAINAAWKKAKATIEAEFANIKSSTRKVLNNIYTGTDYQEFRNMFDADDQYAQDVLRKLDDSWFIYAKSKDSHKDRVDYIRSLFLQNYRSFEKDNKDARYFIKIGSDHAGTTNHSYGYFDVGALTQEIAAIEHVKSTNVIVPRASYGEKDYREKAPLLLNFHEKDRWVLIDLKKLREALAANKFEIITLPDYQELNRMILGFDLLLLPPADQKPVDNR